jgi:hypothetical protein
LRIKKLNGLNYGNKVAITDDLADMGAIRKYMNSNNFDWDDVVIQAFDAGHDILLFSVIERDRKDANKFSGFGDFDIAQLEDILKNFIEYIKSSKDNEKRFRTSLYRNLILKAKIAKSYDQSVNDFLHGVGMERWRLGVIKDDSLKSIPINNTGYEDPDLVVNETLKAGYLEINKATDWNLKNAPANLRISIFTDNSIDGNDEELLKHNFSSVMFHKIRRQKTEEQYRSIYRQLVSSLESSDKIYFAVSTQDDANIIKSAYEQYRNLVQQKLVILIHNTPTLIESNILQGVTVIGCFSTLYASYVIDFDIILGRTEIKPAHYLTISLGSNGSVYDHKKNDFPFALSRPEYKLLPFYATAKEKVLTEENRMLLEENNKLKNDIETNIFIYNSKEIKSRIIISILCIFMIILLIFLFTNIKKGRVVFGLSIKSSSSTNKPWNIFMKTIVNICAIIFFILLPMLWRSIGKEYLSIDRKQLTISETIFCLAYKHQIYVFGIVSVVAIIFLVLFNFPNIFQNIINIFRQKESKAD